MDYESILCTIFNCNKFDIPLKPAKKAKVIEAMEEGVRLATESLKEEIGLISDKIIDFSNKINELVGNE